MSEIVFIVLSAITLLGALLAVMLRNLVHCLLALVLFFLGIAGHYFLLRADFIAASQILIYIGAVAVLILFAIMLTRNVTGSDTAHQQLGGAWWMGVGIATLVAGLFSWAVLQKTDVAEQLPSGKIEQGSIVAEIGRLLVSNWVVPLEILAVLLTAALIGAVVIAMEEERKQ